MNDSRFYLGMDVHKAMTVMVVLNAAGKQIMRSVVETKASILIDAIRGLRGELHLTFEESIQAAWLYDLLKPYVARIVVCNPRHNKLILAGNKSDDIDAHKLADLLRLGSLQPVYHGEHGLKALQELTRSYQYLVTDGTRVKNRIKAIFRGRAIACTGESVFHPLRRQAWLVQLTEVGVRQRAEFLFEQLDSLLRLLKQAHKVMVTEARKHQAFKLLDSIPTLGSVRVSFILAVMLTPSRFRTKRQFWAYIGLALITKTSADYVIINGQIKKNKHAVATRGLNKNFNHTLKMVFKTAAASVRRGPLKDYYDGLLAKGTSKQMAQLTLARKIAAIVLTTWKKGECFCPDKFIKQTV